MGYFFAAPCIYIYIYISRNHFIRKDELAALTNPCDVTPFNLLHSCIIP